MKIYLVGGALRDRFLGRDVKDRDWVVVGAKPEDMIEQGYLQVGTDFPVFLHPQTHEEYALARTERKSGPGYKGFQVFASPEVTLQEDLARRDLTINAIAEDDQGHIIDPFGGRVDLARGVLRHVTEAFVEDPLRVLRVARFAARLDFAVAPETMQMMRAIADSGELDTLSPERVWSEVVRALTEPYPDCFVRVLRDCGALRHIFPELDRLFGVPQPARYHPEIDTGEHILLALKQSAARQTNAKVRFAVLVHDLGKGVTPEHILPSHHGHEQRGIELIVQFCDRYRVPKAYRALAILVCRYHTKIHQAMGLKPKTILSLLEDLDALRRGDRFEELLQACESDATGRAGRQASDYPSAARLKAACDAMRGVDAGAVAARGLDEDKFKDTLRAKRLEAIKRAVSG
jgi:tRNA nucleotidyltransferase (CCA-adding enzyme)